MPKVRRTTSPTKRAAKKVPSITARALVAAMKTPPIVPPSDGQVGLALSSPPLPRSTDRNAQLPADSVVRQKAMHIIAMRMAGMERAEIAKALDLAPGSVTTYLYLAGRYGWLTQSENWADPTDRLEYELSHQVIENLKTALEDESRRPIGKDSITVQVAKGTLFKKFDAHAEAPQHATMLAIKIDVQGTPAAKSSIESGAARYLEGDVAHGDGEAIK